MTSRSENKDAKQASFRSWSAAQGITTNGIDYCKIPNRGLGIVAQRHLKAGETLVIVPFSALVTINTVPKAFRKRHEQITTQGLLASFLASSKSIKTTYVPWASTWPTLEDFKASMPICWRQYEKTALTEDMLDETTVDDMPFPPAVSYPGSQSLDAFWDGNPDLNLLQKQRKKLKADWEVVAEAVPNITFETYVHYWLLVNTRTLYFEMPNLKPLPRRDDRIVMCPFIDLFNHNDTGTYVSFLVDADVYNDQTLAMRSMCPTVDTPMTSYSLNVSYPLCRSFTGQLISNGADGFVLENNRWDATPIDHCLMTHLLDTSAEEQLQQAGYLGASNYSLSSDGVCHRTQVAIRAQFLSVDLWLEFIAGRNSNEVGAEQDAQALITGQVLEPYFQEAENALEWLRNPSGAWTELSYGPRKVLIRRWNQIRVLLQQTANGLVAGKGGQTEDSHKPQSTER
ncbi:MAG: hypothetical protein Q9209_002708 [Squamulea sp. 1 TL-2023]